MRAFVYAPIHWIMFSNNPNFKINKQTAAASKVHVGIYIQPNPLALSIMVMSNFFL